MSTEKLEDTYENFKGGFNENFIFFFTIYCVCASLVAQSFPTLCNPMDYSPPGSFVHGESPGKNTGVSCHTLLQGIV